MKRHKPDYDEIARLERELDFELSVEPGKLRTGPPNTRAVDSILKSLVEEDQRRWQEDWEKKHEHQVAER